MYSSQCKNEQKDLILNHENLPQDSFDSFSYDEIYESYGNLINAEKCDFNEVLVENIPQGTGLTFIAIAKAVLNFPQR